MTRRRSHFRGYEPFVQTDLATEFLARAADDDQPVFLVVSYGPPHDPYADVPETYLGRYDASRLTPRGNASGDDASRRRLHQYYAAISAVDDQIGRMVETLDSLDLTADTLLVVSSDHGDMLGSHGRTAKQVPYEESIGVPLVLSWPGHLSGGAVRDGVLGLVDLAPTLLGLVGAPPLPQRTYGVDLSAALSGTFRRSPAVARCRPAHQCGELRPGIRTGCARMARCAYAGTHLRTKG